MSKVTLTRNEHLRWAKDRALEYVEAGALQQAFTSFSSDLGKHPELEKALKLQGELGMALLINGHLNTREEMRRWIEGFN